MCAKATVNRLRAAAIESFRPLPIWGTTAKLLATGKTKRVSHSPDYAEAGDSQAI
jgi:hypothetical protein